LQHYFEAEPFCQYVQLFIFKFYSHSSTFYPSNALNL
jgi:hypothetical protein